MSCQKCGSDRILEINAKCSDLCFTTFQGQEKDGYPPNVPGVADGCDYIETKICMECGQVQGKFPISDKQILKGWRE